MPCSARAFKCSAGTRLTTRNSGCRPTSRSFRGPSSRATSSPRRSSARCSRARCSIRRGSATAARASARRSRPTPRNRCRCSCRAAPSWAPSTSAACRASARSRRPTCACARTSYSPAVRSSPGRAARTSSSAGVLVEHYRDDESNPDLQPGHLPVRQPDDVPAQSARAVHRPHAATATSTGTGTGRSTASTCRTTSRLTSRPHAERGPAARRHDDARGHGRPRHQHARPAGAGADERSAVRESRAVALAARGRRVEHRAAWAAPPFGRATGSTYNTNNQQNLIVTVTNPPATPRVVIANPTFPNAALRARPPAFPCGRFSTTSSTRACTCGT